MALTFRPLICFESMLVYDVRFAACFEGSVNFVDGTERKRRQRVTRGSWPTQLVTGTRLEGRNGEACFGHMRSQTSVSSDYDGKWAMGSASLESQHRETESGLVHVYTGFT